ncbi:hypothetical protein B5C34_10620 [Pacificimonas flava]|uniref:Uncharacterized protein n=2 Tax=Pacificimonas TaxID=1960290 RepID=A0A219B6H6_9SPHN|nr:MULTISPECIES: hypothetical protein [Pacificimonas]MBZ6378877.1 hypothetical protein [Pacificimonas aurantium]OWV33871.1 hypothetical protein B5C34_10620 [Pacificimonas flava]
MTLLLLTSGCDTLGWREGGERWARSMCRSGHASCTCPGGETATGDQCPVDETDVLFKKPG